MCTPTPIRRQAPPLFHSLLHVWRLVKSHKGVLSEEQWESCEQRGDMTWLTVSQGDSVEKRLEEEYKERKKGKQFGGYGNIQAEDDGALDDGGSNGHSGKCSDSRHS